MQVLANSSSNISELLNALASKIGGRVEVCCKCGLVFYTRENTTLCLICKENKPFEQRRHYICKICGKPVISKGGPGKFCYTCSRRRKRNLDKQSREKKKAAFFGN